MGFKKNICSVFASLLLFSCSAQDAVSTIEKVKQIDLETIEKYPFVNFGNDTIIDPSNSMDPFFEQLMNLYNRQEDQLINQVPIIHYGDSHIQGGYLTEVVRRRLQKVFGNAGRGLVVPLKMANTNEPRDYSISSQNRFDATKITQRGTLTYEPGVGGIAINASLPVFNISVYDVPEDTMDYKFNRIVVFHDSLAPMITAKNELIVDDYGSDIFYNYTTNIELAKPTKEVELYTYISDKFANGPLYAFSLENNNDGILYHSIGVNGACFLHWGLRGQVAKQSKALNPQLIIISMGANEAAGRNFIEAVFLHEVDTFVAQLREVNPNTPILITAPAEAMRRTRNGFVPNNNYALIAKALKSYCAQNKLAFLDLFNIMGGEQSAKTMDNAKLMQRDKLHFTIEGYNLLGVVIYNAIINDFLKYGRKNTQPDQI